MIRSVQSGSRSDSLTTSTEQWPDEERRFAEYVTEIANGNREVTAQREAKKVPPLHSLAAAVVGAHIVLRRPTDLAAVRKFVNRIGIPAVKRDICGSLPADPETLVRIGVPCDKVAAKYGIRADSRAMYVLQLTAIVNGPAGERIRKGEPFDKVGEKYGIQPSSRAIKNVLEATAIIEGPAGKCVRNGEPCDKVAEKYGVRADSLTMYLLQLLAIAEGPAGQCVRNGEPCDKVAEKYGIPADSGAIIELQAIAVTKGPAGECVRKGEPCDKVAEKYGIPPNSRAMSLLQEIAINEGPAAGNVSERANRPSRSATSMASDPTAQQ